MKTVLCQHGAYSDRTWALLDVPDDFDFAKAKERYEEETKIKEGEDNFWFSCWDFLPWLTEKGGCTENKTIEVVDLDML